jgi:hypothetical protein
MDERAVRKTQLDEIGYFEKRALRAVMVQAQGQKIASSGKFRHEPTSLNLAS